MPGLWVVGVEVAIDGILAFPLQVLSNGTLYQTDVLVWVKQ